MKIVAVVVTHNRIEDLKRCVHSLEHQTLAPTSIVVVNNDSTDDTREWLDSHEHVIPIHQANLGSAGGMKSGLSHAVSLQADLIYALDDDALPRPDALEKAFNVWLSKSKKDLWVITSLCKDPNTGQIGPISVVDQNAPRIPTKVLYDLDNITREMLVDNVFENWGHFFLGVLIPADVIKKIGYPAAEFFIRGEDYEYLLRCLRNCRVGIAMDSILEHPMDVSGRANIEPLGIKDYYDIRNKLIINRKYYPRILNSPLFRVIKFIRDTIRDILSGRGFQVIRFYAFYDAIFLKYDRYHSL